MLASKWSRFARQGAHATAHHAVNGNARLSSNCEVPCLLDQAASLVDADPDSAALMLEGVVMAIVEQWYGAQDLALPDRQCLLADLQARAMPLAHRMRLALRAPHVRARLNHARALVAVARGDAVSSACQHALP
jgi:hypothetical protein